ncbi:hypothetical protein LINPERPRIM_LOCUS39612 [Linum perenne]
MTYFYQIVVFLEAYSRGEIGICVPFGKFKADSSAGTASDEDAKVLVSLKGIKFCVKGYSIFYKCVLC